MLASTLGVLGHGRKQRILTSLTEEQLLEELPGEV